MRAMVISIFDGEADAHAAAAALKDTRASVDNAVAVLVLDDSGELKAHKTGTTTGGNGTAAGAVLSPARARGSCRTAATIRSRATTTRPAARSTGASRSPSSARTRQQTSVCGR